MTATIDTIVASICDYRIDGEYGKDSKDEEKGARLLATGAIMFAMQDNPAAFTEGMNAAEVAASIRQAIDQADQSGLRAMATAVLNALVHKAMLARICQCPLEQHLGHARTTCEGHFEADVPEVDGRKLCGTCYHAVQS